MTPFRFYPRPALLALFFASTLLPSIAFPQDPLPDAPLPAFRSAVVIMPPKRIDKTEWALLSADAAIRTLDVYSTHYALSQANTRELLLPNAIAHHVPAMAAYSAGTVALDWWVARRLEARGHRTMAHVLTAVDLANDAPWAIHNLFLSPAQDAQPTFLLKSFH